MHAINYMKQPDIALKVHNYGNPNVTKLSKFKLKGTKVQSCIWKGAKGQTCKLKGAKVQSYIWQGAKVKPVNQGIKFINY